MVYVRNPILWLMRTNSPTMIFNWAAEYLPKHYALDGVADPLARDRTEYQSGAGVPRSQTRVRILYPGLPEG